VASPLLSNIYMRRFVLGWKKLGHETRLEARIVNYADDFVICCRSRAEEARATMQDMMEKLKLTVNETKTRVAKLPEETFVFLGYQIGRCYSRQTGRAYLGTVPDKKRVQRICQSISDQTGHNTTHLEATEVVKKAQSGNNWMGKLLLLGSSQQSLSDHRRTCSETAASVVVCQTQSGMAWVQEVS
jgi:RNA-directed DNA polymerase